MMEFARTARESGFQVIIAGAGGAAHLPGMVASSTTLPVIGVPIPLKHLEGMDSLLSIVQMPAGIPVATVGIGQAKNAGLLALRMLSTSFADIAQWIDAFQLQQSQEVLGKKLPS
jgi:5-(carboxyamino)imidazole ribonucleotide mutase